MSSLNTYDNGALVYERHQRNHLAKNCTPVYRKTDPHAHPLLPGEPKFV